MLLDIHGKIKFFDDDAYRLQCLNHISFKILFILIDKLSNKPSSSLKYRLELSLLQPLQQFFADVVAPQ